MSWYGCVRVKLNTISKRQAAITVRNDIFFSSSSSSLASWRMRTRQGMTRIRHPRFVTQPVLPRIRDW